MSSAFEDSGESIIQQINQETLISLAPTLAYLAVLMLAGMAGNTVVFLVYYKRFKPSVIRTYILAMSVCDFVTNCLVLPAGIVRLCYYYTFEAVWFCQLIVAVSTLLVVYAAFLLLAVAVGRYRAICRPSLSRKPTREAYVALAVCGAVSLVLTVPTTLSHGAKTVLVEGSNVTGTTCWVSDSYTHSAFLDAFNAVMTVLIGGCSLAMLTLYALIARRLWLHKKYNVAVAVAGRRDKPPPPQNGSDHTRNAVRLQRFKSNEVPKSNDSSESSDNTVSTSMSEKEKEASTENPTKSTSTTTAVAKTSAAAAAAAAAEASAANPAASTAPTTVPATAKAAHKVKKIPARTTLMLFVLTAVFVLNYLPQSIVHTVFQQGIDRPLALPRWALNLFHLGLKSYYLNSAINCFIYCFCSARFRYECRRMFCGVSD